MENNKMILALIEHRLAVGAKEYEQNVPLDGSRDHVKDALEEVLDLAVYCAAKLIEIKNNEKVDFTYCESEGFKLL